MKEAVRGFLTGREGMARIWAVLLMICAVLAAVGYSAKAGTAGEAPPSEPNPIEEADPPAPPESEEPAEEAPPPEEETAQTPEDSGEEAPETEEASDAEEAPDAEEMPAAEETPSAGEKPAGASAGKKALSASFTQEGLDELVQKVIDNIITPGMTQREQAKAVWSFAKNGISYTGKSDKSDWRSGAYEGLRTRRGDCFTYYAVSRALLTALGIDNLEVQRVGGPTSHYWNLVNCGDGWYHFDATPRSSKMPYFVSFMFTDQEAADYTARAGRNYYSFDGSLYPERAGGAKEEPAKPADPAPETPPAEDPAPETPPVEDPAPETPPAEDPAPEAPPAEEPDPEAPPAEEPAPETPPAEEPPVDVVELPPAAEAE